MLPMMHNNGGRIVSVRYAKVAIAVNMLENITPWMPVPQQAVVKGVISTLEGVLFDLAKTDAEVKNTKLPKTEKDEHIAHTTLGTSGAIELCDGCMFSQGGECMFKFSTRSCATTRNHNQPKE